MQTSDPPLAGLPVLLWPLHDFASQRAAWFVFNVLFSAIGLWTFARWIGGPAGLGARLLAPLLWTTQAAMVTFQVGNVHFVVVTAVMLSRVALDTRRPAIRGSLLAFALVSKTSPALFLIVLLLQRPFQDVFWTSAWCVGLSLAGLVVFGPAPSVAFVQHQLPLGSGEALAVLSLPESSVINLSPYALPSKLERMGVDVADPWAMGSTLTSAFTVALVILTATSAWRGGARRSQAELWAALSTLAPLRSPLAPATSWSRWSGR